MRSSVRALMVAVLMLGVVAGCDAPEAAAGGQPFGTTTLQSPDARGQAVVTIAPMLERVTPAVVNISAEFREPSEDNPLFRDPTFRRFFGIPDAPVERRVMSAGSGVIVDAGRGLVLTNHHVVEKANRITVTLKDRRRLQAQLVGSDPATDIALLRIPARDLTQVSFADSDQVRVGDMTVAIGNPFGLGQTVTSGIVSALGRSGISPDAYEDFIQTDASINPGNSGGALVNSNGELMGINTAILSRTGLNVGIGFAVPSNIARSVMEQLVQYGEVRRGRIGIVIQDVSPDIADSLSLERGAGAIIARVEPGTSAAQAGLRQGDVVVAVDGRPVETAAALRTRIGLMRVGERVELTILRNGERRQIGVTVRA